MLLHNTKPERLLQSIIVRSFTIKSKLCIVNCIEEYTTRRSNLVNNITKQIF